MHVGVSDGGTGAERWYFGTSIWLDRPCSLFVTSQVTRIARAMVTRFGMSPLIGPVTVNTQSGGNPFIGRSMSVPRYGPSSATQRVVDDEVMRLVMAAYSKARGILEGNRGVLDTIARQLVERENVSAEELQVIIEQGGVKMGIYE